jgi:predicted type IV restriction endonuclease
MNSGNLNETIADIRARFKVGDFIADNESAIKQGIIIRVLDNLLWPIHDPSIVYPEYPFEGGRVDYALCHPPRKPIVLIEAKRIGKLFGAEVQLFSYAFHKGVPMAILTDGLEWHFFLPCEQGDYHERRLCKAHIISDDIDKLTEQFQRYLSYESICSDKGIEWARQDYRQQRRNMAGSSKEPQFLEEKSEKPQVFNPLKKKRKSFTHTPCRFEFHGKEYKAKNRQEAVAKILNILGDENPTLLDQLENFDGHGQYRKYIAKSKMDLYPDIPERSMHKAYEFRPGWWIPGGIGTKTIRKIAIMVCEIGGFEYGKDLIIHED